MSRIGKLPVVIPEKVEVKVTENTIEVKGETVEKTAALRSFSLNKEEQDIGSPEIDFTVLGRPGINILDFRLEAEDQGRAVHSMAVYSAPYHPRETVVEDGIRIQVGQELLDDGDPDVDDLATIAEGVLNTMDFNSMLAGQVFDAAGYAFLVNSVSIGGFDIGILCGDALFVTVDAYDVEVDFYVDYLWGVDGVGTLEQATMDFEIELDVENGEVVITTVDQYTDFTGVVASLDYIPGFVENWIVGWAEEEIEQTLGQEAQRLIEEMVAQYLNSFSLNYELFAGVSIEGVISDLDVAPDGLRISSDALFVGDLVLDVPSYAGSALVAEEAPSWPLTRQKGFGVALSGDLINQLLLEVWGTGFLSEMDLDGVLVQGLAGAAVPPPIGPVGNLRLDLGLPPSFTPPTESDMDVDLSVGEWQMKFTREDEEVVDFRVNMRAGVDVYVEDGKVKLGVDQRTSKIDLGVSTLAYPEGLKEAEFSALGRLMIPSLLGSVGRFLPSFELPVISLGNFSTALEGEVLEISDPLISVDQQSWLLLEADLR